ncbi:MAG: single-stranded-DNA-specific exonuclease RecJ [Clostridia bacterium]|nr:single-stranded-DNA-specific exonuclease RecJ [Clostridia bacterium]
MKKWEVAQINKELAKELANECDIDPFVAMIAASRGYDDPAVLDEFLSDDLMFSDPFSFTDMEKAVACINEAIEKDELIAVYGDYDCDGVTATALLYNYLTGRGARVICRIPDRFTEGYGMNENGVRELYGKGVSLIITVDNGISCIEEIDLANSLGVRVVVTDHHLPPEVLPNAVAVVDPHRIDDYSEFKDICGVGVAFNLICALEGAEPEEMINEYGDLVAVGTIGDVMPLISVNRSFVKAGLLSITENKRCGIAALMQVSGLDNAAFSATRVSFGLVPRINAAGRMGSADRALQLLTTSNEGEALRLAEEIAADNLKRQQIEKEIFDAASDIIEKESLYRDRVIVVAGENWHHGIVGIVASKICEYYCKPTIVLSIDGDLAHGSGRSIEGFSLYDCINSAREYTEKFGGHSLAAGMTLKKENINIFRSAVNSYAHTVDSVVPVLKLDCKLNPAALSLDIVEALSVLQPYGTGNSVPVFGIFGAELEKITAVGGGKHLKLSFIKGPISFQAMLFSCSEGAFPFKKGDILDLAVGLDTNLYNGKEYLSIIIKDYRLAGINDTLLAKEIAIYDDFCSLVPDDYSSIAPTREECGMVYKYIKHEKASVISVEQRFMNELGLAKVKIIIDVFVELGLIERIKGETDYLAVSISGGRVNLDDSAVLRRVRG